MTFFIIIVICGVGYWYVRNKRQGNSGNDSQLLPKAKLGLSPAISDNKLMELKVSEEKDSRSFEDFKRIEQTYGASLREALEMLFGTLVSVKGHKLRNGNKDLTDRAIAKAVATIDQNYVIPVFKGNQEAYNQWWNMALGYVTSFIFKSEGSSRQAQILKEIITDYENTNNQLESVIVEGEASIMDHIKSMDVRDAEFFVSGPKGDCDVKLKLCTSKSGLDYYELSGAYKFFNTDVNTDEITSKIELIIASLHWLSIKSKVGRYDIEKYPMPSTNRLQKT